MFPSPMVSQNAAKGKRSTSSCDSTALSYLPVVHVAPRDLPVLRRFTGPTLANACACGSVVACRLGKDGVASEQQDLLQFCLVLLLLMITLYYIIIFLPSGACCRVN